MLRRRTTGGAREGTPLSQGRSGIRISLLGGFQLEKDGPAIILPEGSQRLLAFLALKGSSRDLAATGL